MLQPKWYPLQSKRSGKKSGSVTGAVQLQCTISDPSVQSAAPLDTLHKFASIVGANSPDIDGTDDDQLEKLESLDLDDDDDGSEVDDSTTPGGVEKKKKRLRLRKLKKKAKEHGYEFSSGGDIAGVLFLEIRRITDLPPEKNSR